VIPILVVIALCVLATFLIFYSILIKHYPATIDTTISALTALALVFLLEYPKGPIEFQGLGFKFKGAAGPLGTLGSHASW
jgi:hypothetical protein